MSALAEATTTQTPRMPPPADRDQIETYEQRSKRYRQGLLDQAEGQSQTLKNFLLDKLIDLKARGADSHRMHLRNMDQAARYLMGEQYGRYNADGTYEPYGRLPGDVSYCIPVIIGHFQQALMMLLKTQPEYQCFAKDKNNPAHTALARMCESLGMEDFKRLMNEESRYDEATNSLTAGESHRCLMWGVHDNPKTTTRPIYEEEEYELPGSKDCKACGFPNFQPDATNCALCDSDYLTDNPGEKKKRQKFKGTKEVYVGQNILHIPHMTAVKSDLAASTLRQATYIIETDYLASKSIAEWHYQSEIDDGPSAPSDAVRIQRQQQGGVVQVSADGAWADRAEREQGLAGSADPPIERNHVWMEASEYGYKVFTEDQTLPDGQKVKKNIPMGDQYPAGFKFCVVGDTIVNGGKGFKKLQWSRVLHGKRPGSSRGMGIQIAIPLQDIVNDTFNLDYTILMTSVPFRAMVKQFVNKLPAAGESLLLNKMPIGGISNAVAQFTAQTPSGAVGATSDNVERSAVFILGTATTPGATSGGPDTKQMGTATGVAAAVENANGRVLPFILQRIACDKEFLTQLLLNIQQHSSDEQKEELSARFGADVVADFFQANFEHVVIWEVAPGTDKPRSDALTQAVLMEFGNTAANMIKAMPNTPWVMEYLSTLAEMLGVPFKMAPGGNDRREAERRLTKLAAFERAIRQKNPQLLADEVKASQIMFGLLEESCGALSMQSAVAAAQAHGDESGVSGVIPFLYMQDHQVMQDAMKDQLMSEQAATFSPAHRAVLARLYSLHVEAFAAAESLKTEFQSGLAKKLAPVQTNQQPTGEAKIIETLSYKDAPEDIKRQIEAKSGMNPSQEGAGENEADAQAKATENEQGGKVVDHQLSEAAKDAQLQREIVKKGHEAETQIAIEHAKAKLHPKDEKATAKK